MPLRSSISNARRRAGRAEVLRSLAAKRGLNGGKQRTMCLIEPHPPAPTPVFRESLATKQIARYLSPIALCRQWPASGCAQIGCRDPALGC